MITKPMLAAKIGPDEVAGLAYPVIVTPKLDGIRCVVQGGKALSRRFKPIPNDHVRKTLEKALGGKAFKGDAFDGELMVNGTFQDVSSGIMSKDGEPDFTYHVFDWVRDLNEPYQERLRALQNFTSRPRFSMAPAWFKLVPFNVATDEEELLYLEDVWLKRGYEGICLRTLSSPYKEGRSTLKEQWLVALKRFVDAEAVIVGFEEQEANLNEASRDAVGNIKRSSAKAGRRGKRTLGAFIVESLDRWGEQVFFRIGTGRGLTAKLRQEIWDNQRQYLRQVIKYRYQSLGTKDKPRIPSFLGFRDRRDM